MISKYQFKLRFHKKAIGEWAERYLVDAGQEYISNLIPKVKTQGFYTQEQFLEFCKWKSRRTKSRVAQNPADYVETITKIALSTPSERLRIEILRLLYGVDWPTASVLLHFGHQERYPIIDFRALWSLGIDKSQTPYIFNLWWEYTQICRKLADDAGLSMRELDRALWKYFPKLPCQQPLRKSLRY